MRKALGRGLDALLPQTQKPSEGGERTEVRRIAVDAIKPNHLQPRKNFDPERLAELAQTIKEHGLAQPIMVSYDAVSNSYELIAGERRLRATKLAGLEHIDAVVRTPRSDRERLALALIENIQRDGLNAIETAQGYRQLMAEFSVNQSELTKFVGKSKSAISNTLRLLELPDEIQKAVQFEQISEGHARALLMVQDGLERNKLFKMILESHLSVRKVEELAQFIAGGGSLLGAKMKAAVKGPKPPELRDMEIKLQQVSTLR